jgi:glyoxylase-like metal-dependent hydrolase (beta-lactamase superfamily II)
VTIVDGRLEETIAMKTSVRWIAAIILSAALFAAVARVPGAAPPAPVRRPELEYLAAINRAGPPSDPQLLFLLMAQYADANLHGEGAEFFTARLREFEPQLSDAQQALYLSAIGVLRAGHAAQVPFWRRLGWVKETIGILDEAKRRSGGTIYVVRWMSGVVGEQLPAFFGRADAAREDLTWCLDHADQAPHAGWSREVYYHLASLARRDGDSPKAEVLLRRSGYTTFDKPVTFTTASAEDAATGHTFSPKRIVDVVPGKVYALSGFEFTEYYFVVSEDRRELVAIDAGTRPDSAKAAYEALRAHVSGLPELTTVLVTHSHWDHVGGHEFFRGLDPRVKFYARANYREEQARSLAAPEHLSSRFFGKRFRLKDVASFQPDVTIDHETTLTIGGSRFELIPIAGGETNDGMFIHLANEHVLFAGDFIMPYLGAPFVEEGNFDGLLSAIDVVERKYPRVLLHGHEPLTRVFGSVETLVRIKPRLRWLRDEVLAAIRRGEDRATIQQANLIPPGLLEDGAGVELAYLVLRENVINRLYDQNVGYWQPDLEGVDYLGDADRGSLLIDYLGVSDKQLANAADRMIADGRPELAASALRWAKRRLAGSEALDRSERVAYLKLMEKYQEFNPFKLIVYAGEIGMQLPQMSRDGAEEGR